ncbi:MAG TPA: phosphatase PAP2-related protein, partial [Candidatus Paceibacterota bacterium]
SNSVTDLVLSNVRVFDVDALFVYGAAALVVFIIVVLLLNPKQIPFTLYSLAIFFLTRAAFISLTHVGPFPTHTPIQFTSGIGIFLSRVFLVGDDLFFSAHTGVPFLMALVFWRQPLLRYIFLAASAFFGAIALLGHIHYSIDVASAFFIAFGIYHITLWLFEEHRELFLSEY